MLTCALPAHPAWAEAGVGIEEIERLLNSEAGRAAVGREGREGREGQALPIRMREHFVRERPKTRGLEALIAAGAAPAPASPPAPAPTPAPTSNSTYNPFLLALIGRFVLPSPGDTAMGDAIAIARGAFIRIEYVSIEDQAFGTLGPYPGGAQRRATEYSLSGLISVEDSFNPLHHLSCWHLVHDKENGSWAEIEEPDLASYGITSRWVVGVGGDFDTALQTGEVRW